MHVYFGTNNEINNVCQNVTAAYSTNCTGSKLELHIRELMFPLLDKKKLENASKWFKD